ncbi:MAG: class I SAM-dependent methyltransferase [Nanoarchaeota archaeon]|nr:class I SAM-dependent methyltransferase [Nanoarchaeota archaeon]
MKCDNCKSKNIKVLYKLKGFDVAKCGNCGLRFSWPPLKHSYEEGYFTKEQKDYFESKDYEEDSKAKLFGTWLKEIEKFVKPEKGKKKKILDVGCATGVFLDICKKHCWDCYGIDISKYATEYARKKFKVKTKAGDLINAKYKDNFFDVVFMSFFIEHVSNPDEIIKESKRILKKGGILFVSTINEDSLLNLFADIIYKISLGVIKKPVELLHARHHLTHFSEKDIVKIIEKNNFKILDVKKLDLPTDNFGGGILKDIILKFFYFFQKIFNKEYIVWVIGRKK